MTDVVCNYTASRISTAKLSECLGEVSLTKKGIAMQPDEGKRKRSFANAAACCVAMTSSNSCSGVWRDQGTFVLGYSPTFGLVTWRTFCPDDEDQVRTILAVILYARYIKAETYLQ